MRLRNRRWLILWVFLMANLQSAFGEEVTATDNINYTPSEHPVPNELRGIFAPRMDYDQWKPLGRGDPLKNDPTYDYVPPVLDRVHYWIDPALRKPDPPVPGDNHKTEILLLGISSKKPSTSAGAESRKDYDQFLKFVDGPKFNNNNHQRVSRPTYFQTNFFKNKVFPKVDQKVPYTMLMPPPMVTKKPQLPNAQKPITIYTTNRPASVTPSLYTTDSVSVQPAQLVYQSSSLSGLDDWRSADTTNLTPNPITFAPLPFNEDIVFQKHLTPPEAYIPIQFAPHNLSTNLLVASNSEHNINYVTPPPLEQEEVMHKGQVSDDNLDISNTYVKIGKTEAQVHSTAIDNIDDILIPQPIIFPSMTQQPLTMQSLHNMQSMQPPPVTTSPVFKQTETLEEITERPEIERMETTTSTTTTTSLTTDPIFKHYKQPAEPMKGPLYLIIQGHSKVKTYGPTKQFHGIRVQETNEIGDGKEEPVHYVEDGMRKVEERGLSREGRSGDLQTLKHVIETGLGAIDFTKVRRNDDNVKETEVRFGYEVGEDATSEKYRKGIVEAVRKVD